jgi:Tfp pilus assembly protein PilN
MSAQPKALRLADALEQGTYLLSRERAATAAELRRLSIENDALGLHLSERMKDLARVEAQRDALLEALQSIADCCDEEHAARDYASRQTEIRGIARAAIKAAEEKA